MTNDNWRPRSADEENPTDLGHGNHPDDCEHLPSCCMADEQRRQSVYDEASATARPGIDLNIPCIETPSDVEANDVFPSSILSSAAAQTVDVTNAPEHDSAAKARRSRKRRAGARSNIEAANTNQSRKSFNSPEHVDSAAKARQSRKRRAAGSNLETANTNQSRKSSERQVPSVLQDNIRKNSLQSAMSNHLQRQLNRPPNQKPAQLSANQLAVPPTQLPANQFTAPPVPQSNYAEDSLQSMATYQQNRSQRAPQSTQFHNHFARPLKECKIEPAALAYIQYRDQRANPFADQLPNQHCDQLANENLAREHDSAGNMNRSLSTAVTNSEFHSLASPLAYGYRGTLRTSDPYINPLEHGQYVAASSYASPSAMNDSANPGYAMPSSQNQRHHDFAVQPRQSDRSTAENSFQAQQRQSSESMATRQNRHDFAPQRSFESTMLPANQLSGSPTGFYNQDEQTYTETIPGSTVVLAERSVASRGPHFGSQPLIDSQLHNHGNQLPSVRSNIFNLQPHNAEAITVRAGFPPPRIQPACWIHDAQRLVNKFSITEWLMNRKPFRPRHERQAERFVRFKFNSAGELIVQDPSITEHDHILKIHPITGHPHYLQDLTTGHQYNIQITSNSSVIGYVVAIYDLLWDIADADANDFADSVLVNTPPSSPPGPN